MKEVATTRYVSVIIPAYNAERFLARAVASAVQQGEVVLEIIIVENNSQDQTLQEINRLKALYGDLIVSTGCATQGAAAARNHGLELAKGKWIQFLDADDYLYEGKIARQLGLLNNDTCWVMGLSDVLVNGIVKDTFTLEEDVWRGLLFCRGLGDTNANLFRRDTIVALGGYDRLVVGEDYHLYFKLLRSNMPYVRDAQPGSAYVQHDSDRGQGRGMVARWKWRKWFVGEIEAHLLKDDGQKPADLLPLINSAKLAAIRMMLTVDEKAGSEAFDELFGAKIPWSDIDLKELPRYAFLYRFFDFLAVERLRVAVGKLK